MKKHGKWMLAKNGSRASVRLLTRDTARPWWVALETMKELEDCLKKLDRGVSRKRRN